MRLESGLQRNLSYRFIEPHQVTRGALQAQAPHVPLHGFANEAPENPVKMKAGKCRDARHVVQFQRVIEMLLDVHERSNDPLVIVLLGGWLHFCASRAAPNANAGSMT